MKKQKAKYIDIHAHIEHLRFDEDRDDVIKKCEENGVLVLTSGVNPETNKKALELGEKYDNVLASFGLYPVDALKRESDFKSKDFDIDSELKWIEENKDKCVAIGEIGLDYADDEIRYDENAREKQKKIFKKILKLAEKIDKPVVIHSRKAEKDVLGVLDEDEFKNSHLKIVMHCFSGKKSLINKAIERGCYFSIPPVITRLEHFRMLVDMVSLDRLLTETDSPYLSPKQGERNTPDNVAISVKEIAKIKNIDEEDVRKRILNNGAVVFGSGINE